MNNLNRIIYHNQYNKLLIGDIQTSEITIQNFENADSRLIHTLGEKNVQFWTSDALKKLNRKSNVQIKLVELRNSEFPGYTKIEIKQVEQR